MDEEQQYYELDVTDLVLADYASEDDLTSAFRLQVTEAIIRGSTSNGKGVEDAGRPTSPLVRTHRAQFGQ